MLFLLQDFSCCYSFPLFFLFSLSPFLDLPSNYTTISHPDRLRKGNERLRRAVGEGWWWNLDRPMWEHGTVQNPRLTGLLPSTQCGSTQENSSRTIATHLS
jgi:hypothetical protein